MSQPYCVVKMGCCEWEMDPLPAVYGPFDNIEAESVAARLSARYGTKDFGYRVMPLVGVPPMSDRIENDPLPRNDGTVTFKVPRL